MVRTYWEFLFMYYMLCKEWRSMREVTNTVSLYIMQYNSQHNYIAIYMLLTFQEWMFWCMIISSIYGVLINVIVCWNPPLTEVHRNCVQRSSIDFMGISNPYIHAHMNQIQHFNNTHDSKNRYVKNQQV